MTDPLQRPESATRVHPSAIVEAGTTLGEGVVVHPFAVLGGPPQHLRDSGEGTTLEIGARTIIREHVTVHRGTRVGHGRTLIGSDCILMAASHVGHDCRIGNSVIITGGVALAGHCDVGDFANLGGHSAVHQFCRIGTLAMVAACTGVSQDIPPYCMAAGYRARLLGLNEVGLDRRGVAGEAVRAIRNAYRVLFRSGLNRSEALQRARDESAGHPEATHFVDFVGTDSPRNIARHGQSR